MRMEDDGPVGHTGPFILAIEVNKYDIFTLHLLFYIAFRLSYVYVIVNLRKTFVFELWCEQKLLLRNLDMSQAIASFLHLAFVFDLKYPQASTNGRYPN